MKNGRNGNGHEQFEELCALAMSGSLTPEEQANLQAHLRGCVECREEYDRYLLLTQEGIPMLARRFGGSTETETQKDDVSADVHERVMARIAVMERSETADALLGAAPRFTAVWRWTSHPLAGALAACLLVVIIFGAHRFAQHTNAMQRAESQAERRADALASEKGKLAEQFIAQQQKLTQLEVESSQKRGQIEQLKAQLQTELEHRSQREAELAASLNAAATGVKAQLEDQLRASAHDREVLAAKLHDLETAYENAQTELVNLRTERERVTLRLASLEVENNSLAAMNRDQERQLRNDQEYLASDRDIRDLMGSRQLYMADVLDVTSDSRTRKPYGRIFYTKNKRLLFYAFDLDRQRGVKNVTFQAWGRNESQGTSVNLGILYQDDEQNRRWVLRFDDPHELAEIDAVFVTVEPHGGSQKPTGKPFLTASLRREPNHP